MGSLATAKRRPRSVRRLQAPLWLAGLTLLVAGQPRTLLAEPPPLTALTLRDAVLFALDHHPSLQTRRAIESEAASRTELQRAGYLPQIELGIQLNRATGNVLAGSLFPMRGTPAVSGPPLPAQFDGGAFGSLVSLSAAWDATGLARRMAEVDAALSGQRQAQAGTELRKLEVAYAAADSYLQLAALRATVQAARANVERARTFAILVEARQKSELRPGADLSRARAELALADTQLVRTEQTEALGRVQLSQALGTPGAQLSIAEHGWDAGAAEPSLSPAVQVHPALAEAAAATLAAQAQTRAAELQYLPRVDLVAALWARGSGLTVTDPGGSHGLLPDTPNWAAGLVVSWPALELFSVRARVHLAEAQTARLQGQREELAQSIQGQLDAARAMLEAAVRVAEKSPIAVAAARTTEQQAQARYRAGLADVLAVAEAQRLLAQAESEDAVAHIAILRARLLLARATGDLAAFLGAHSGGG